MRKLALASWACLSISFLQCSNLVITLTPLGLLYFLHVLLLVFFWVYFARLVFRVVAASPTPEGSKKSGKSDLLMKLLHYIPAFAAAEAIVTIIRVFFVPVVLATCFGLGLAVHWIDFKILDLVQGESYESFLDLVTVDFTKGAAPGMVQSAFVLVCIAIGLDLIEVLFSFLVEIRRLARLGSGGRSDSFYSAGESESKFEMRPHGVPISWPQPAHLSKA